MQLSLQTFTTLVQNMAAAVQSSAAQLLDLTAGSALRAILEANASLAPWLQWLILQVLQATRAATSTGADLDSWMADFALVRMPASPASGLVSLSRYTPTLTALAPLGALVRTADGTQTFAVVADTTNPAFSAVQAGYILAAGVASVTVPVVAQVAGSAGNVQAARFPCSRPRSPAWTWSPTLSPSRTASMLRRTMPSVARFRNFIASRSRALLLAIGYAVSSVQQGLSYTIAENVDATGAPLTGNFVATVDDGSGAPSPHCSRLSAARSTPCGLSDRPSWYARRRGQRADLPLGQRVAGSGQERGCRGRWLGDRRVREYPPIGAPLPVTRIAQVAYGAHPAVTNVTNVLVNGGTSDVAASPGGNQDVQCCGELNDRRYRRFLKRLRAVLPSRWFPN